MAKEKRYKVVIDINSKELARDLAKAKNSISSFTNDTTKNIKKTDIAWGAFVGSVASNALISGVTAAKTAVVSFLSESIQLASDAEETLNKFNVVFADVRDEADKTAENLATNFGLSSAKAKELLSDTGDLLTGFGFTGEAALDLSRDVNELAVDLASFTNFSGGAEGASRALTKALLGERESVKSLGISILEEDVKMQVLKNTQNDMTFASERQAKAYATLQIATSQSKNAIGDFERSMDSNVNQSRILDSKLETLKIRIGTELLPAVIDIKRAFIQFLDELDTDKIVRFTRKLVDMAEVQMGMGIHGINKEISDLQDQLDPMKLGSFQAKLVDLKKELAKVEDSGDITKFLFHRDKSEIEADIDETSNMILEKNKRLETLLQARKEMIIRQSGLGGREDLDNPDVDNDGVPNIFDDFSTDKDKAFDKKDGNNGGNNNDIRAEKENEYTIRLAAIKRERKALMDEMDEEFREQDFEKIEGFEAEKIRIEAEAKQKMIDLDESFQNAKDAKAAVQAKKELDLIKFKAQQEEKIEKEKSEKLKKDKERFFQDAISLTNSKSGELVAIGKAAALTNIAMDTEEAVSGAYAWGTTIGGPPLGIAFGAIAAAAQAQRAANVMGIEGFETGGVIADGTDINDRTLIRANRKERVLTAEQNRAFEELVFNGNQFGTNDTNSLLIEINNNLKGSKQFFIDGEEMHDKLSQVERRKLK